MQNTQRVYSVPIGQERQGQTRVRRNPYVKDGLKQIPPELKSFADFWDMILKRYPQNKLCEDLTFTQVFEIATKVGSWLTENGHKLIYLYCKNRVEWTITDVACMNYSIINVPLYDTLGQEAFDHILKITEGTILFSVQTMLPKIVKIFSANKYSIQQIVLLDSKPQNQDTKILQGLGLKIIDFSELTSFEQIVERPKMNLDTPISYSFTSGTTGIPKGVVTTHRMGISQAISVQGVGLDFLPTDVHMSFLPIAHTYQRYVTWLCMYSGTNIRYTKYPITEILKDIAQIRPTIIPFVPRLINKFYPILLGLANKQGNYDKIRLMFGGRLRIMITGSAPISPEMLKFFKKALNCIVIQGYGQTQTTAASFLTWPDQQQFGHLGSPNNCTQYKLIDVPQMNYLTKTDPPKGQILIRGQSVFRQYFKNEQCTSQTLDSQGWNHTGDIGTILPNGALKIIDRRKNIFKLQQGQYVAPQRVQNIYARCNYITESYIHGDPLKTYNIGIIHPNMDALSAIATKLGLEQKDPVKLCDNEKINKFILDEIIKQGKQDGLHGFEQVKKIKLWPKQFALMGILTSTMKLQRHLAKKIFEKEIEDLYKD